MHSGRPILGFQHNRYSHFLFKNTLKSQGRAINQDALQLPNLDKTSKTSEESFRKYKKLIREPRITTELITTYSWDMRYQFESNTTPGWHILQK